MGINKNVVLITSGQPSANPRLVKEAVALDQAGYTVTVIYVPISLWADEFDKTLIAEHPTIKFIRTGYHSAKQKVGYRWARIRRKLIYELTKTFGDKFNILDYSTILFGQELYKEARKHKADLYIAHNLGALPAAVKAAKINKAKVGFDAEDFHRGEFYNQSKSSRLACMIEDKYFRKLNYFSAASPLIAKNYQKLFPNVKSLIINNTFEKKHAAQDLITTENQGTLKLFWFSQVVGKGRGLECAIKTVCEELKDEDVTLTLLGNCSKNMLEYLEKLVTFNTFNTKIKILAPTSPNELFSIAQVHHIGLALEPGRDFNNNIALSNKIFTYILTGNAIIASDTEAQSEFMNSYFNIGILFRKNDEKDLANALKLYLNNRKLLEKHRQSALALALSELNWENESQKLLQTVREVLKS